MVSPEYFSEMEKGQWFDVRGVADISASAGMIFAGCRTTRHIMRNDVSRRICSK
jgi:hypothetical protein